MSYATGTLLAAAFLAMIPKGLAGAPTVNVSATVLAGIVIFFLMEKIVIWRHCHTAGCEVHGQAGALILLGDALHNFVDGLVIAAAFVTSIPLGMAAAFAVIAHEVPQEVGDFAILLDSGYSRRRAFLLNLLSSFTTLPGALAAVLPRHREPRGARSSPSRRRASSTSRWRIWCRPSTVRRAWLTPSASSCSSSPASRPWPSSASTIETPVVDRHQGGRGSPLP